MKNPIPLLRTIGRTEAVSFLVLLAIAMPLKYVWGMPAAVKVVGWIHGGLFVLLCLALWQTKRLAKWPLGRATLVFGAALLPFGPFVIDRRLAQYQEEFQSKSH